MAWRFAPLSAMRVLLQVRRALGCRKRLAAQLATCSDALSTWIARAAIVCGAFMLRARRFAILLKKSRSTCVSEEETCVSKKLFERPSYAMIAKAGMCAAEYYGRQAHNVGVLRDDMTIWL